MINLKTAHEIDLMARAGSLLASVLPPLKEACQPGVKTIELDRIADKLIRQGGAIPGFLGYNGFPRSICVSINDEAVHGIPGNRKIAEGDLVSLDLGLVLEGFWADVGVDRKSTRLNSSHANISYAVFCLKKKKTYTSAKWQPRSTTNRAHPTATGNHAHAPVWPSP